MVLIESNLLEGDGEILVAAESNRHGKDGTLAPISFTAEKPMEEGGVSGIQKYLDKLDPHFGLSRFDRQPWNPILLEC